MIDKELKQAGVVFKPYVGNSYAEGIQMDDEGQLMLGTDEHRGKKPFIVGESHYADADDYSCMEDLWQFTEGVVMDYLDQDKHGQWKNTFVKFERSLYGRELSREEKVELWQHVAFANYLQVPIGGTRMAGKPEDYEKARDPFFEILRQLRPDCMIVWGYRLFENLPSQNWTEEAPLEVDGGEYSCGYYTLEDGHRVHVLAVYHPSVGYAWTFWHKVIARFFSTIQGK